MDWENFKPFTATHFLALIVCLAAPLALAMTAGRIRSNPGVLKSGRRFLSIGSVVIWLIACGFWFYPGYFRMDQSLPLHFCNIANLIAVAAVGLRARVAQSLLYFWTFALCIWAFLTPFLTVGPAHPWFWVFWLYHLFIPLAAAWVLAVDRFRPQFSDLKSAIGITFLYTALLALLNAVTGWNYGFVGQGKPGQPSLIDFLGPYPIRLLWMTLIAALLFSLLLLPWKRRKSSRFPP
ncbi:MAG: TIGR02206 family membrane protein [Verrucomicrobiales bacterium]|nr:TIGR02206 family membrane protein [Verrucomicrobiales bacterium]